MKTVNIFRIIFSLAVAALWGLLTYFLLVFIPENMPPDGPLYKIDENHWFQTGRYNLLWQNPPGGTYSDFIYYEDGKMTDQGQIKQMAISDKYIVIEGENCWLGIDRKTLQKWLPYPTLEELEKAAGAKFSDMTFTEGIPESLRYKLWPIKEWLIVTAIAAILLLGLWLPSLWNFLKKGKV